MRKINQNKKKTFMRVIMLILAVIMVLGFVLMPAMSSVYAETADDGSVTVSEFETGRLADAINTAKGSTDLNQITGISVLSGTLNSADYNAICGYPNVEFVELAGCSTENGIIPDNAVASRNQLSYISLPANTVKIGARAFSNNKKLTKVSCPDTLREIGDYAFESCEALETIYIPAALEKMGEGAFKDCKAITAFEVPEAITHIPSYCFSKCNITELHIGPQVTSIGDGAFSDCYNLTDIYYYGDTAPSANEGVFQNLRVTIHTYDGGTGFDAMNSNFVTVAYDLDPESEYIPPKEVPAESIYTDPESKPAQTSSDEKTAEESKDTYSDAASEEKTEAETMTKSEDTSISETTAAEEKPADPAAPASSSSLFSGVSVAIIVILTAALAVTATLLAVNKKKK